MSQPHQKPKLPGRLASIIETIVPSGTMLTTLPDKCREILDCSGGELVTLYHINRMSGNQISSHDFIFLLEEKKNPTEEDFMQIELRAESIVVILIVRKDNLYLIGFSSNRGYFELESREEGGDRLLPGAQMLNINVNYLTLLNIYSKDGKSDISTRFSPEKLIAAICAMDSESTESELKRHLGVVIVMIIESARSPNIMMAIMNRGIIEERKMTLSQLNRQITSWDRGSIDLRNYWNDIKSGRDATSIMLPELKSIKAAALKIKAVHFSQERKLHEPAPTPSAEIKWNDTRKGESSSKKSKKKSKNK